MLMTAKKTKASSKTKQTTRKSAAKKLETYSVAFTVDELLHLRDLFNVLLPPAAEITVSQSLAESEEREVIESNLWNKLSLVMESANVPMEDDAPDYVIAMSSPPSLAVFQIGPQES
jgi:ribosome biogenesis protein Tsr3